MSGIAETAYLLDDAATAGRVHDLLAPYGHLPAMASLAVACFGSTSRALGVAAMGDFDRAVDHLNSAVQHNLALGHWPAVVVSRTRHAQALAARGGPGDDAAAARELATATRDAAALGMPAPDVP